ATFPNVDSISRKVLRRCWPQYKLEHLYYFSKISVLKMSEVLGLKTIVLKPLMKKLPIDYYLSVGSNFGPETVKKITKIVKAVTPGFISRIEMPMFFGEWLFIVKKNNNF
ncbi:hypothetical protein ACFL4S_01690, partial [bacterium]